MAEEIVIESNKPVKVGPEPLPDRDTIVPTKTASVGSETTKFTFHTVPSFFDDKLIPI